MKKTRSKDERAKRYECLYHEEMLVRGAIPEWAACVLLLVFLVCLMVVLCDVEFFYKVIAGLVGIISFIVGVPAAIEINVIEQTIEAQLKREGF